MVRPKKQSKRVSVRLRHSIEKKISAKAKKQRKLGKKDPTWRTKLKKDPGIPNLFPYKDRILAEIEDVKRQKEEEKLRLRELVKEKRKETAEAETGMEVDEEEESESEGYSDEEDEEGVDEDAMKDVPDSGKSAMSALLASARARAAEFDSEDEDLEMDEPTTAPIQHTIDPSLKHFSKHFQTVLSAADVLLYVLDARDPTGTRSPQIEQQIRAASLGDKRLILLINKIDLVPPPVLQAWLVHLRRYFPALPIRASKAAPNARTYEHKDLTTSSTAKAVVQALKSYAKLKQLKRAVTVGVVGYPNVGKSSVINAILSRGATSTAACPVGAEAGVTTAVREVKLDSKLKLLDSPGVVFAGKDFDAAQLTLLNALPPKQMPESLIPAVTLLLSRLQQKPEQFAALCAVYSLPPLITNATQKDLTMDFLVQVARKRGRLGKGGVPNLESAARAVVTDWRDGRITGWVDAPLLEVEVNGEGETVEGEKMKDQKAVVAQWAEEFKIDGLWGVGQEETAMDE